MSLRPTSRCGCIQTVLTIAVHGVTVLLGSLLLHTDDKVRKLLVCPVAFGVGCYLTTRKGVDEADLLTLSPRPYDAADNVVGTYFGPTTKVQLLPDIGSRLMKTWSKVGLFVSMPRVPRDYQLDKDSLEMANNVLHGLKHPNVLPVLSIECLSGDNTRFLMIQQWEQTCSLRDLIYENCDPSLDWSDKYAKGKPLPPNEVASCGRQILEGMLYLYDQGFPNIGHVQSGNVFVQVINNEVKGIPSEGETIKHLQLGMKGEDSAGNVEDGKEEEVDDEKESFGYENSSRKIFCRVGGYENMLLGYKTRLFGSMANHDLLDRMDLVMFGQLVYEMACGQELHAPLPEEGDYESISDGNDEVKTVLRKIFELCTGSDDQSSLAEVRAMNFFKSAELPTLQFTDGQLPIVQLPEKLKEFLHKFPITRK